MASGEPTAKAPSDASFEVGAYVRIEGLKSGTQHNGRYGFVVNRVDERFAVVTAHADFVLNVKPANLVACAVDRKRKTHEVVMVYPTETNPQRDAGNPPAVSPSSVLVAGGDASALKGWPTDWKRELRWLQTELGWKRPITVSGVHSSPRFSKPDLVTYFDAESEHCFENAHARVILRKLAPWEFQKVKHEVPKNAKIRAPHRVQRTSRRWVSFPRRRRRGDRVPALEDETDAGGCRAIDASSFRADVRGTHEAKRAERRRSEALRGIVPEEPHARGIRARDALVNRLRGASIPKP